MCEFSTKLIAWHDGELPDHEAAAIEQHIRVCSECRSQLDAYQKVSSVLNAYCDAALASKTRSELPRWAPVVGAAASVALLLLIVVHMRAQRSEPARPASPLAVAVAASAAPVAPVVAPSPVAAAAQTPAIKRVRTHSAAAAARAQRARDVQASASWPPSEPAIQIAIPGEAIFPPGALPPGVDFVADVSIAADGSAQRLGLQPRLTGFEGGPKHP